MMIYDPHCEKECPECFVKTRIPETSVVVQIERCILPELQYLWRKGIYTMCSCCGHGFKDGWILVDVQQKEEMEALGYEVKTDHHYCDHHQNVVAFKPKGVAAEAEKYPDQ